MKRLIMAFLGLLVATSAVAEQSAWFVGGTLGYGSVTLKYQDRISTSRSTQYLANTSTTLNGTRFGVLGGYKQFFTEKFGLRYYAVLNLGSYNGVSAKDYHINVDALFNFITIDEIEIGVFGGLGLGKKTLDDPLRERWGCCGKYKSRRACKYPHKSRRGAFLHARYGCC